jgi:hypothetical protein
MLPCAQYARAVLLACLSRGCQPFPVFFTANGSAVLTSAHGADIVLQPDGAGAVVTRGLLQADAGVQLNATTLNEAVLSGLLSLAQAQSATLAQLVAITAGSGASSSAGLQTTYALTACGMSSAYGPNLALCRDAYAPAAWAADRAVYGFGAPAGGSVSNWQRLTLPQGGRYSISVAGASGSTQGVSLECSPHSAQSGRRGGRERTQTPTCVGRPNVVGRPPPLRTPVSGAVRHVVLRCWRRSARSDCERRLLGSQLWCS